MYSDEVEYTVSISIDGTKVHEYVESVQLSFNEDQYVNTVEINFSDDLDSATAINLFANLCNPENNWGQERVSIVLEGIEYKFLLERRTASVRSTGRSFSVWGRSKGALLDLPFAKPIVDEQEQQNLWQTSNMMASQIISQLLSDQTNPEILVDFNIDDFPVYSDNFTVSNQTPISIINKLAEVPGGRVRSKPNGNLILEYKNYNLADSTTVYTYTELDELIQIDEEITNPIGYNKVEVSGYGSSDTDSDKGLQIELDDPELSCLQSGVPFLVRIYTSPLTLGYNFDTTVGNFSYRGSFTETKTEEIIFSDGRGNVSYPIKSVTSYDWVGDPLGTVEHQEGYSGLVSSVTGFGVLSITYVVSYDVYEVTITEIGTGLLYAVEDVVTELDANGNPVEEEV